MRTAHALGLLVVSSSTWIFAAGEAQASDEPIRRGDRLIYPFGYDIPRSLTRVEKEFIDEFPLWLNRGATPPPTGPLRAAAEYEPMDGILFAYQGTTGQLAILRQMVAAITTTGNANCYIMCDSTSIASSATTAIAAQGANMSHVFTYVVDTDTIWIRDYGPRYAYEGDVRVIIDHTYNRPRPMDDAQPFAWSTIKGRPLYEIPLVHGGGNYHLNALSNAHATRLIVNENPGLTEAQIIAHWLNYQGCNTTLHTPFPTTVDSTQHIDMWMQIIADNKVMISDWPLQSGSAQDVICDAAAVSLAASGYTVYRIPAYRSTSIHYTFTNVVMCNNLVLIPMYVTNATAASYNATALATFQAALPGKTIVQINCDNIVGSAGVMHCIVMHVPVNAAGANPVAYLKTLRGGQTLTHGQNVAINWISDDDAAVTSADVLLSIDGGVTFPITLASNTTASAMSWNVSPTINTAYGRIRVVVRDAQNNLGSDESDSDLVIGNPPTPGDVNLDGSVNVTDLLAVIGAWGACPAPCPPRCPADVAPAAAGDCTVNVTDLLMVIGNWG